MKCKTCNNEMSLLTLEDNEIFLCEFCSTTHNPTNNEWQPCQGDCHYSGFASCPKFNECLGHISKKEIEITLACEGFCPDCSYRHSCKDSTFQLTKEQEELAFEEECNQAERDFDNYFEKVTNDYLNNN